MTDKEIIRSFECCTNDDDPCKNCRYDEEKGCYNKVRRDALDLINRQQQEIERLKKYNTDVAHRHYDDGIKEFAESLKKEIDNALESNYKAKRQWLEKTNIDNETMVRYIDGKIDCLLGLNMFVHNLVKEMVGADNDI